MNLKDIDLNLLLVFKHLYEDGNVSQAAGKLGLSQPATSNALRRLRTLLNDELFIRTAGGMQPTAYATQLAEPIAYALDTLQRSLTQPLSFSPTTSTRTFTVSMTDLGETVFLPKLMHALAEQAPNVTLSTVRNNQDSLHTEMETGHVDLAIGLIPQLKTGFFQQRLFMQRYVCLFRAGHALDGPRISAKQFYQADHVAVIAAGTGHDKVHSIMDSAPDKRRVRLYVPHFTALGEILCHSDLVATVPERYAQQVTQAFNLRYLPHPIKLPTIGINMFWHAKYHREPGNQWLRQLIFKLFSTS